MENPIGLLNDIQLRKIQENSHPEKPFISPYTESSPSSAISYGLSSYGYDARLSGVFKIPVAALDPKNTSEDDFERTEEKNHIIVPSGTFILGTTVEHFNIPDDLFAICIGKSTYARCGIIVNVTPIEPGWCGHITVEISNTHNRDARVYVNEGIMQLVFFRGETPRTTYRSKKGKYQAQQREPIISRMSDR